MHITLTPEQISWLESRIADGEFASFDDAFRRLVADRMAFETDGFDWTKPQVDLARREAVAGKVVSLENALSDIDAHLATLTR
jgi:Arc/MetJ-type ribon-helix-helix transcriptional regulator